MVLNQLLMFLVRDFLWVAFCCAVLVSFVLLFMEERGKREEDEADAAGDDRSWSELEKSNGGVGSSGVAELVKSGEERCDLGGLGHVGGVEVDDEGDVFDESPERDCGLGDERVRVLEPGEDGVEEKKMDDGNVWEVEVISGSFGAGGDDGLGVGVEVLEVSGGGEGDGVGGGAQDDFGFEEKLDEDNGEVVEAEVLDGRQVIVLSRMEAWVAGAVRALERYERVDGEGGDGEMNGNVVDGENRGLVEDDEKNRLVEDDGENKRMVDDEEENKGSSEDLVAKEMLVEDDHGNKRLTELEDRFDDNDWEGIERTELEKRFGAAVAYIGRNESEECLSKLSSSVKMQLYGLHQVATRGPCTNPQPRIFQVSARSNWNAWRQAGDMSPEEAMEKYIALLSENVDNWIEDDIDCTSMN